MADAHPAAGQIQAAIDKIRGVIASRVIPGDSADDPIEAVHVLASTARPAKWVVRDVESVLFTRFGIRLDHRKVSVAQIETAAAAVRERYRPRLEGMRIDIGRGEVEVSVRIGTGSAEWTGTARGQDAPGARARLAAIAALRALEEALEGRGRLQLDDLVPFSLGGWEGYLVGVTLAHGRDEEMLVGSALARRDDVDAAVKAVLNAVNRWFDGDIEGGV
ncbi:MAG TPA: hypothetical protein VF234_09640 [Limnochordia bacterium]